MIQVTSKIAVCWLGSLLLLFYLPLLLLLWRHFPEIANENGLMENLQALTLAVGVLVAAVGIFLPGRRYPRFVFYVLTIFLLALFLREVDIETFDVPEIVIALGSGTGRNLLLMGVALLVLALFAKDYRTLGPAVLAFLRHRASYPFYLGVLLYLTGNSFEKHWFPLSRPTNIFFEELSENAATAFFLWGVIGLVWGKRLDQEAS